MVGDELLSRGQRVKHAVVICNLGTSTDVRHITSLRQVVYVQRIRCIKDSP
jgi:hypothetical protein